MRPEAQDLESTSSFRLRRGAWFEDKLINYSVPAGWTVRTLDPQDAPALSADRLAECLHQSWGSPRLSELARGKKDALIVVDDLSRPTPTWQVLPDLVRILVGAGIPAAQIQFLIATGSHRPLRDKEMRWKLGNRIVDEHPVWNHDAYASDLKQIGCLRSGIPLLVNPRVVQSDLVIGLGCVIPHPTAGFSGGGKIIVPGAAGALTIACLHGLQQPRSRGVLDGSADNPDP